MILPENKPKNFDITPRVFLIYGLSMSGKTYLARQFPNPLLLNTDGNCEKVDTPSIKIKSYEELLQVLNALTTEKHSFETIIIDLLEDIETMLTNSIIKKYNETAKEKVDNIQDVGGFGKGFSKLKTLMKNLIEYIVALPYNIIFITHAVEKTDGNTTTLEPNLSNNTLNITSGRCDVIVKTVKIGNGYVAMCVKRRDKYTLKEIKENLKPILTKIENLIEK